MNQALVHLALRRVWSVFGAILILILLWVLLRPWPLETLDPVAAALGLLCGCLTALRLFTEAPDVRPFLFSRAFSRARFFWTHWITGLALLGIMLMVVTLLLVLGARSLLWGTNLPFYPMIQFHELRVLWPLGALALLAYQLTTFMIARDAILAPGSAGRWHMIVLPLLIAGLLILAGLPAVLGGLFVMDAGLTGVIEATSIYITGLALLTTGTSVHAFRRMEVVS